MPLFRLVCRAAMIPLLSCAARMAAAEPQSPALLAQGAEVYAELCAGCHGADALGGNGPDITRTPRAFVAEAARGIDQMPEVDLTEDEIDAVAAYLATLY